MGVCRRSAGGGGPSVVAGVVGVVGPPGGGSGPGYGYAVVPGRVTVHFAAARAVLSITVTAMARAAADGPPSAWIERLDAQGATIAFCGPAASIHFIAAIDRGDASGQSDAESCCASSLTLSPLESSLSPSLPSTHSARGVSPTTAPGARAPTSCTRCAARRRRRAERSRSVPSALSSTVVADATGSTPLTEAEAHETHGPDGKECAACRNQREEKARRQRDDGDCCGKGHPSKEGGDDDDCGGGGGGMAT